MRWFNSGFFDFTSSMSTFVAFSAIIFLTIGIFANLRVDALPQHLMSKNNAMNKFPQQPLLDAVNHFSYTGSSQIFTVPLDVNSICVYMW